MRFFHLCLLGFFLCFPALVAAQEQKVKKEEPPVYGAVVSPFRSQGKFSVFKGSYALSFLDLPGWGSGEHATLFVHFVAFCRHLPSGDMGLFAPQVSQPRLFGTKAQWNNICKDATSLADLGKRVGARMAKAFFEKHFSPIRVLDVAHQDFSKHGFVQGFTMADIPASRHYEAGKTFPILLLPQGAHAHDFFQKSPYAQQTKQELLETFRLRKEVPAGFLAVFYVSKGDFQQIFSTTSSLLLLPQENRFVSVHVCDGNNQSLPESYYPVFCLDTVQSHQSKGQLGTVMEPFVSVIASKEAYPLGAPLWIRSQLPQQQDKGKIAIVEGVSSQLHGTQLVRMYAGFGKQARFNADFASGAADIFVLVPQ